MPILSGSEEAQQEFKDLLQTSGTNTTRIAIHGDSQETDPGGAGTTLIPSLNRFAFEYNGILSESPFMSGSHNYSTLSDYRFLHRGATAGGTTVGGVQGGVDTLPGYGYYLAGGASTLGSVISFFHDGGQDASGGPADADVPINNYYDVTTGTSELVVVLKKWTGGNPDARIRVMDMPQVVAAGNFFAPAVIDITTSGLNLNANDDDYVEVRIPLPTPTGYWQFVINGTGVVGARVEDTAKTGGLTFDSFSRGGQTILQFLNNHPDMCDHLKAMGPHDATMITLGANDCFQRTLEEYKADLEAMMDRIRTCYDDPDHLFILVGEPKRNDGAFFQPAPDPEACLFQSSVHEQLACESDSVVAFNASLLADDFDDSHFNDSVHLSQSGQQLLAQRIINTWANL